MKKIIQKLISRFQLVLIIIFVLLVVAAFSTSVFGPNGARIVLFLTMIFVLSLILYSFDLEKKVLEDVQNEKGEK